MTREPAMNGAESLIRTLAEAGVDLCIANPGTSEIHLVAALDHVPAMRAVTVLFEGVATGAADGYARMAGKPAATLLHLGPGLANGLANLHNARRAGVPIVNIVGEHPGWHHRLDAPLTSDIQAIAGPASDWVRTASTPALLGADGAEAVAVAQRLRGIATLIVPADAAWGEGGVVAPPLEAAKPPVPQAWTIVAAAEFLRGSGPSALLVSGSGLMGDGLAAAGRIAAATGARILAPFTFARLARGAGRAAVERIPYVADQALAMLAPLRRVVLVGAPRPASYFGYPGKPGAMLPPEAAVFTLAGPDEDCGATLMLLAEALDIAPGAPARVEAAARPEVPTGAMTLVALSQTVAAMLPEAAIVVDESLTSARGVMGLTKGVPPHDWLVNTGGSIGIGMPLSLGAALACPDRPVLCLSGDGSAMYTVQALWSLARVGAAVTIVLFANRSYAILKGEMASLVPGEPGATARSLLEIGRPDLDFVALARGMGVPARRVETLEDFAAALSAGFASHAPNLIEIPL